MIKVLIADDEKNICMLLQKLIDWEQLQLSLVGEAHDGRTAYDMIMQHDPDIVIIDIKMPEMDGLEVIQKVKAAQKETVFLLISGHRDFEFAHAAIQYGVENYLLKPINRTALHTALTQAIKKIENRKQSTAQKLHSGKDREQLKSLLMQQLLYMPSSLQGKTLAELCEFYEVRFAQGTYQVACIQPDELVELNQQQFENLLTQLEIWFGNAFQKDCDECLHRRTAFNCMFLLHTAAGRGMPEYASILEQAQVHFYPFCHLTIGLSRPAEQLKQVDAREAQTAVLQRLELGIDQVILYGKHAFEPVKQTLMRHENELWQMIEWGDQSRIRHWFEVKAPQLLPQRANPEDYVAFFLNIMERYGRKLKENYPQKWPEMELRLTHAVKMSPSREQLMKRTLEALLACQAVEMAEKQKQDSTYVRRAKEYVQTHYGENVTLEDIARITFLNPSYFCTLFKKEEGINFSEYLIQYRLERAKMLLNNFELSIADVAKHVGYSDVRYFSKIFCKAFGIKPSEYRRTL